MSMFDSYVRTSCSDPRYTASHFILSEVDSKFLKRYGINKTVVEFKKEVRTARYDFKTKTGNAKKAPMKSTKVYNISNFK